MIKAILLLAIISSAFALDKAVYKQWKSHVAKYNRKFQSADESRSSYENFARNLAKVNEHNKRFALGLETYEQELNQFGDSKPEEIIPKITGLKEDSIEKEHSISKRSIGTIYKNSRYVLWARINPDTNLPASVDHTAYIVGIKNQGQCGSCYAHATATAIEIDNNRLFGEKSALSVQQIIDCSTDLGNGGCNGGTVTNCHDYIVKATNTTKGLLTAAQAPYTVGNGTYAASTNCAASKSLSTYGYKAKSYHLSLNENVDSIKTLLRDHAAFCMVYVDQAFMNYKTGIFKNEACTIAGGCRPNHAVVFAGYGVEGTEPFFWLVNSWGTTWGINGKMKIGVKSALANYLCSSVIMEKL